MSRASLNAVMRVGHSRLIYFVEKVPLRQYFTVFWGVVAAFGVVYWLLTPCANGMANGDKTTDLSLLDGLYFSVVTVSSLGYGDIHPLGISKLLACVEVIFGLAILGIIIAKISSHRLSYHVRRLFEREVQARLQELIVQFESLYADLDQANHQIATAFQETPTTPSPTDASTAAARQSFSIATEQLHNHLANMAEYVAIEVEQGGFFDLAADGTLIEAGDSMCRMLMLLSEVLHRMTSAARDSLILNASANRTRLLKALDRQREICRIVDIHCSAEPVRGKYQEVMQVCDLVPEGFFSTPMLQNQPNEIMPATNEPLVT